MRLPEYAGKELLHRSGFNIPEAVLISHSKPPFSGHYNAMDVNDAISSINDFPRFAKLQVPHGGRKKRGLVKRVCNTGQLEEVLMDFQKVHPGTPVLLEKEVTHEEEHYVSVTLNRSAKEMMMNYSGKGGVEVEKNADLTHFKKDEIPSAIIEKFGKDFPMKFFHLSMQLDALLLEINPLTEEGMVLDAKIEIDDAALFRHEELSPLKNRGVEEKAKSHGLALTILEGDVGVIANGAGLTMATLDYVEECGGKPGVFLDLGGTDDPNTVKKAYEIMSGLSPKYVIVNVFGGITRCDSVAKGLIAGKKNYGEMAITVRLRGNGEEKARKMLSENHIPTFTGFQEMVKNALDNDGGYD